MSLLKEIPQCLGFLSNKNKEYREIVFYSERSIYYKYYEGLIKAILENTDYNISYITSDINDEILCTSNSRIKTFYANKLLPFLFPMIDSKVLIMTMPDLNQYHIKRSTNKVNHIYVFHAIVSTHMMYNKGAFDYYDTIFCVGPHQSKEIRQTEEKYNLPAKELVETGYHLLEKIHEDHQKFKKIGKSTSEQKIILIAPSWNDDNILETCIDDIISRLLDNQYKIFIRPHPEFIKRKWDKIEELQNKYSEYNQNFVMELKLLSNESLHMADALITDWSGIAYEYAFGTERPVLFINTPRKINNPAYKELGLEPMEVQLRSKIGKEIQVNEIENISSEVEILIKNRDKYREQILNSRNEYVFNWGKSSQISAEYIINYLKE